MALYQENTLKAIDFFCGAGGMTYGLRKAGINVIAGIDNDIQCKETYTTNNHPSQFIHRDISTLECGELAALLSIERNDDNLIL